MFSLTNVSDVNSRVAKIYPPRLLLFFIFFQSDILDVNEIFKDLATLVNEQGETIGKKRYSE